MCPAPPEPVENVAVSAHPPARVDNRAELPSLAFEAADGSQRVLVLSADSSPVSVGRGQSVDLRIDWDDEVSRLHARLERVGGDWDVVDDGFSRNGTFVNGARLTGRRRLKHGDAVRFGATTVTFRSPARNQPRDPSSPAVSLSSTQRRVLAALCRPCGNPSTPANPATDQQIADELILSVQEVATHLRVLGAKLGIEGSPSGDTARRQLVDRAFAAGLIAGREL
jgi:predicted component of type VI protein secretion system